MLKIVEDVNNELDHGAYIADTIDKIENYIDKDKNEEDKNEEDEDEDEDDEEPVTYCDNCGKTIWNEDDIVEGDYGEYCCEECLEEAEGEEEDEDEDEV